MGESITYFLGNQTYKRRRYAWAAREGGMPELWGREELVAWTFPTSGDVWISSMLWRWWVCECKSSVSRLCQRCSAILHLLGLSKRMHQGLKPFAYTGHPPPMPSTFRLEHSLLLSTMPGSHFRLLTQQMLTLRSLTHSHSLKRPLIPRGVRQARQFLDSCTRLQALQQSCQPLQSQDLFHEVPQGKQKIKAF